MNWNSPNSKWKLWKTNFKDELKTTREALATAQEQVNKSEEQLRSELMMQVEEEINRISLERARLQAVQYTQQHQDVYGDVATQQLVWEVGSALEQKEFYYVEIHYQPSAESAPVS